LQQESATQLATIVPITMQEDFLWNGLCDNAGKHTFSGRTTTTVVYFPAINSLPSTLWNSISLMCAPGNRAHCAAHI